MLGFALVSSVYVAEALTVTEHTKPLGSIYPKTFSFVFPNGDMKWRDEMTREDLIEVIDYLLAEQDSATKRKT